MSIGLRLRQEILRRDGFACKQCGRTAEDGVKLEVDHKTPRAQGGGDTSDNLWTLCDACNNGKSSNWNDGLQKDVYEDIVHYVHFASSLRRCLKMGHTDTPEWADAMTNLQAKACEIAKGVAPLDYTSGTLRLIWILIETAVFLMWDRGYVDGQRKAEAENSVCSLCLNTGYEHNIGPRNERIASMQRCRRQDCDWPNKINGRC